MTIIISSQNRLTFNILWFSILDYSLISIVLNFSVKKKTLFSKTTNVIQFYVSNLIKWHIFLQIIFVVGISRMFLAEQNIVLYRSNTQTQHVLSPKSFAPHQPLYVCGACSGFMPIAWLSEQLLQCIGSTSNFLIYSH